MFIYLRCEFCIGVYPAYDKETEVNHLIKKEKIKKLCTSMRVQF